MTQTSNKTHWPSLIILLILGLGIFTFLIVALVSGMTSVADLFDESAIPASSMIQSVAAMFELAVLFICAWFVLQKAMLKEQAERLLQLAFSSRQVFLIPLVVIF